MATFLPIIFLVFPVCTDDINTDSKGLFYNMSPFLPEKGSIYLYICPWLGHGKRPGPEDTSTVIPNDPRNKPNDRHFYGIGTIGAGYGMLPQLELFLGVHGYGDYIDRRPWSLYRADTRFIAFPQLIGAVKTGFPQEISPSYTLSFGFVVWYAQWIAALVRTPPHPSIQEEFMFALAEPHDIEIGIRGMSALKSPIGTTFLNLGYFRVIDFTPSEQWGFNSFGIGQEIDLWHYIHPAIEIAKQDTIGSIIPQVKFILPVIEFNFGAAFPVFSEFDWVPDDSLIKRPKWIFSLSPRIVIRIPPKPKPTILITGTVYDSLSLKPLPATISFLGPVSGKIETKSGEFKLEFVLPGAYEVGIETPDFTWEQRVFHLMEYDTVHADWPLVRKVDWSVMGRILDVVTKKGVPATVRLVGKKKAETFSDPASGEYRLWVNAGKYELCAEADGYHSRKTEMEIPGDRTIHETIYLLPSRLPKEDYEKYLAKKTTEAKGPKKRRRKR